jgi:hypothetical protein
MQDSAAQTVGEIGVVVSPPLIGSLAKFDADCRAWSLQVELGSG